MEKKQRKEIIDAIKSKRASSKRTVDIIEGLLQGDRQMLSKAITLIESTREEDRKTANEIIETCIPYSGKSIRIGITGVPGVGKSSFIESFGLQLCEKGRKLAVLAIDPSSQRSKGSILGDKTRMERLVNHEQAFIRPSPSASTSGGVAAKTRESVILCEAAGFDTILIETVGVGQSELAVHSMVDFFLLLMLSGAGDELQGIKRGIMEMADSILITKADGDNIKKSNQARQEYKNAMHLLPPHPGGWIPQVETCSALSGHGLEKAWNIIESYQNQMAVNGYFNQKRKDQAKFWMHESILEKLKGMFYNNEAVMQKIVALEKKVISSETSPFVAANEIIDFYKGLK